MLKPFEKGAKNKGEIVCVCEYSLRRGGGALSQPPQERVNRQCEEGARKTPPATGEATGSKGLPPTADATPAAVGVLTAAPVARFPRPTSRLESRVGAQCG